MAKLKKIFAVLVLVLGMLPLANTTFAKSQPGQYKAEIAEAEKLGKIIYEKDIAAWVDTDKMLEELGSDVSGLPIRGWVTDKDGNRWRVNFIGEKDVKTKIYYQAWVKGKKVKKSATHRAGIALSDAQMAMWRARKDAMKRLNSGDYLRCSQKYNSVVIPVGSELYVYLFASTIKANEVVMGGHHRLAYSGDGKIFKEKTAFSNSCLVLDKGQIPEGATAVALTVTHLRTNYPQEHHVFINRSHMVNLMVGVSNVGRIYEIIKGKIKLVAATKFQ